MRKLQKLLISDVDGTVYRGSLLLGFYAYLVEKGCMEGSDELTAWSNDKKNDLLIKLSAEKFRGKLIGIDRELIKSKAEVFISTIKRTDTYEKSISMIEKAKNEGREIILLSGSPKFLIRPFAKMLGVKSYATIFETCEDNKFNGEVQPMWARENKDGIIKDYIMKKGFYTLEDSIGLGDVFGGDYGIWKHTTNNYIVNPSRENLEMALEGFPNIKVFY